MGRFLQTDPIGYEDQYNLYAYVGNDPVNAIDPSGKACTSLNTSFCANAHIYRSLNEGYRERTTFFEAASIVSTALNEINTFGSGIFTSDVTKVFLTGVNKALFNSNSKAADRIARSDRSVVANDRAFVRFEQNLVQKALDKLKAINPDAYDTVVSEGSAALNGSIQTTFTGLTDSEYANAVSTARDNLGVENLDFGNKKHRIAIGDALTKSLRVKNGINPNGEARTGSRIRR